MIFIVFESEQRISDLMQIAHLNSMVLLPVFPKVILGIRLNHAVFSYLGIKHVRNLLQKLHASQ